MKEIININVGECGTSLADTFWNTLNLEHGINENDGESNLEDELLLQNIGAYYKETRDCFF